MALDALLHKHPSPSQRYKQVLLATRSMTAAVDRLKKRGAHFWEDNIRGPASPSLETDNGGSAVTELVFAVHSFVRQETRIAGMKKARLLGGRR